MSAAATLDYPNGYLIDQKSTAQIPLTVETLIGRDSGLNAKGVSRQHCMVRFHKEKFYVADINSRYGTFLNHERLEPNQWKLINPGDLLTVGDVQFKLSSGTASKVMSEKLVEHQPVETTSREKREDLKVVRDVESDDGGDSKFPMEQAGYRVRLQAYSMDSIAAGIVAQILAGLLGANASSIHIIQMLMLGLTIVVPLSMTGQTVGMKIMGLRLVNVDGSAIDFAGVFLREIAIKWCGIITAALLLGLLTRVTHSEATTGIVLLGLLGFFAYQTKTDGMLFWDKFCDTRVILEPSAE